MNAFVSFFYFKPLNELNMRPYNGIFHNRTYTHILCGCTSSLSWISTPINIHFIANTMLENDSDGIKHMEYTYFS